MARSSPATRPAAPLRYSIALVSVAAALGLSELLRPFVVQNPFLFFFAAVAVSAWYGGLGTGLAAIALSAFLSNYFFIQPWYAFSLQFTDLIRVGGFMLVALIIVSLTEAWRQAEAAAQMQRERFAITLASIGDAVIVTDEAGRVTFMNSVAEALTGWPREQAIDHDITQVFHIVNADTRQAVESPVARVLREGVVVGLANHTVLLARDGVERSIDDSGAPIRDAAGEIIGVVMVFRDVTERKQTEEALQRAYAAECHARTTAETAVHLRDQFFSIAAHELKTPLTTLIGNAQLIQRRATREDTLSHRDQRNIQVIVDQAMRLNKMVLAMLDVTRIETGQLAIERVPLDLSALVRRIVEEVRSTLDGRMLFLSAPDEPLMLSGDELRLEQVLQNLIQNALKYSRLDQPVRVEVTRRDHYAYVAVIDRGIGIPQAGLPQLFQRFYRADNVEQHIGGVGIGLYVVKEIVSLHGGQVAVESAEGVGSTFTIGLPLD